MPTGPIIKEGFPLIGAMLIITVVLGYLGHYVIAIISFILALFFVNFFRNPKRVIPQDTIRLAKRPAICVTNTEVRSFSIQIV